MSSPVTAAEWQAVLDGPTFCQRLLNIDLYPGSFEDPDGDVIHLSIPCSFGFGHDGLCEFPLPRRAVGK